MFTQKAATCTTKISTFLKVFASPYEWHNTRSVSNDIQCLSLPGHTLGLGGSHGGVQSGRG